MDAQLDPRGQALRAEIGLFECLVKGVCMDSKAYDSPPYRELKDH